MKGGYCVSVGCCHDITPVVEAVNARHPGRATLTILKGKDHKESAETAYSRRETWDWLLR